jgi:dephospho-CoA kinase
MKLLGLTGGIGMGKSTAAGWFVQHGFPVVDTDDLARDVVQPGQPALREIQDSFGPELLSSDGSLNRAEMARRVFSDPAARQVLERILHPRIRVAWMQRVAQWRKQSHSAALVVIPLLYEIGAETEFDSILAVGCTPASQQARLLARGWTATQIQQRIASQMPAETKLHRAHFCLWTEGFPQLLGSQWNHILKSLSVSFSTQKPVV